MAGAKLWFTGSQTQNQGKTTPIQPGQTNQHNDQQHDSTDEKTTTDDVRQDMCNEFSNGFVMIPLDLPEEQPKVEEQGQHDQKKLSEDTGNSGDDNDDNTDRLQVNEVCCDQRSTPEENSSETFSRKPSNRSLSRSMPDITQHALEYQNYQFLKGHYCLPNGFENYNVAVASPFNNVDVITKGPIIGPNIDHVAFFNAPSTSNGLSKARKLFSDFWGCLINFGKGSAKEKKADDWEIPVSRINDLQLIGSGAQGAVFFGRLDGLPVAVKKVREKVDTDIKHLRKLDHPNIVSFKGVCTQPECYCIIMEYCPNGQLYEILKVRKVPPNTVVDWSRQIASGMNYLHQRKIIHRDLKSPNVLMSANNVLKISDFGNSRLGGDRSMKMSFAGTVAWMAPEVIRNERCSEKVKIIAL